MRQDEMGARAAVIEVAKDPGGGPLDIELRERAAKVLWNLSFCEQQNRHVER